MAPDRVPATGRGAIWPRAMPAPTSNCDRRRAYLAAATELLVDDLGEMVADWGPDGAARTAVAERDDAAGLTAILTGIGSLSYGELGGERMKLGLLLHDPEEEHDCFSDNTHNSHYYDQVGMMAIWNGRYTGLDGKVVEGPSVGRDRGRQGARGQGRGRRADGRDAGRGCRRSRTPPTAARWPTTRCWRRQCGRQCADPGVRSTRWWPRPAPIEAVVAALDLKIEVEGSDSLDNPSAVGQ